MCNRQRTRAARSIQQRPLQAGEVPVLRETAYRAWLATTPEICESSIGVIGQSEQEARQLFAEAVDRWLALAVKD